MAGRGSCQGLSAPPITRALSDSEASSRTQRALGVRTPLLTRSTSLSGRHISRSLSIPDAPAAVTSLWSSTRRQKAIFLCLFLSDIAIFTCLAIMAPFYPREAELKGMSSTVSGWVFGMFSLIQFASAPVFGKLMPVIGERFLLLGGSFFGGGCSILFGFLDQISTEDGGLLFTLFSFLLRIMLALGSTASCTATFAIATSTFPDNASTVLGFLETAIGLGLMLGPALGGVLYEAGGFMVPFVTVGAVMILLVPVYCLVLPAEEGKQQHEASVSILDLLRVPIITLILLTLIVTAVIWVALDPTLEPHLRPLGLSPSQVGLAFLMVSGTYAIGAPITGKVADRMSNSTPLMAFGFLFLTAGLLLIGPSPLLGLGSYSKLWLNLVSLLSIGIGNSLAIVPTFGKVLNAAIDSKAGDSFGVHGAVAGLWTSVYALGEFIGPVYAAAVSESIGFPWCMTIVAGWTLLMMAMTIFIYLYETNRISVCCRRRNRRYSPLLPEGDRGHVAKT